MLVKVLAPAFYSRKDPRTPVRIAVMLLVTTSFSTGYRGSDGADWGCPARMRAWRSATSIAA